MSENPTDFSHILINSTGTCPSPRPYVRWRQILLVVKVHVVLIINAKKRSVALPGVSASSPSYTVPHTHESEEVAGISPTVSHISLDIHPDDDNENHKDIKELSRIVKEKNLVSLHEFGGVERIATILETHPENGIHGDAEDRRRRHAPCKHWNTPAPAKSFFHFFLKACKSPTIILLLFCAALSLGFGLKEEGPKNGWHEGVTIFVAVFVLVTVPSVRNLYNERKLYKSSNKNKIEIEVVRDGQPRQISISDVVVGDIVCLKTGDEVPADGLLLSGYSLHVDEELESMIDHNHNPFLLSGAKVTNGHGRMVVVSLDPYTAWSEMMGLVTYDPDKKKSLQTELDKVSSYTQNIGLLIAILLLVVLFMRYKHGEKDDETGDPELNGKITTTSELMKAVERIIIKPRGRISTLTSTLAVLLVGIHEGLPFVVTLCLSYWRERSLSDKVITIEELSTCVTVGSVHTICTEITGGLTLKQMEVDMFMIGEEAIDNNESDFEIAPGVIEALGEGVVLSVMAPETSTSPIGALLLPWAEKKFRTNTEQLKQNYTIVESKPLHSDKKASGVLMKKNEKDGNINRLHWKGDAATILTMCSHYYDRKGIVRAMDEHKKQQLLEKVVGEILVKGLEWIAFAYKQTEVSILEEEGLILLGFVGVKDPYAEARTTVESYYKAGVDIILVSGDDMSMVRPIAIGCGIHRPNSNLEVLKAEDFRNLPEDKKMEMVGHISMMTNCLPSDKLLLVQHLKKKGHVVAVVGVGRNDCPALKEADVGIFMGNHITEIAKNSSDIVILDGSFRLLANILMSGRCAYYNIQKFIQLELTMNIAGLLISSVSTVSSGESPITALQLLSVNLVVGILGALALLTEPKTHQNLMEKPPVGQIKPLITKAMWRNIIAQVSYQVIVLLTFQFKGRVAIPGMDHKLKKTMIFNTYVLCQVFNQLNATELEKKNVFKGIHQNRFFQMVVGFTVVLQVVVEEFANSVGGCVRLNWKEWAVCVLTAMASLGIDLSVKCISGVVTALLNMSFCSLNRFTSTTPSAPHEAQLELPLRREESSPFPS